MQTPSEYVFFWEFPIRTAQHAGPQFEVGDEVIVQTGADRGLQGVVEAVRNADLSIREGAFFPVCFDLLQQAVIDENLSD